MTTSRTATLLLLLGLLFTLLSQGAIAADRQASEPATVGGSLERPALQGTFVPGSFVSPTLEGCRGNTAGYLPGTFICPDVEYTSGNLGKGWNELDLVPHRLTTSLGNQASATTDYNLILAADNSENISGFPEGYDFISTPVLNAAKSHASCALTYVGNQGQQIGVTGGVYDAIYRIIGVHQDKGTTCVFDYIQRLSITSADFNGSSLQAYMFEKDDFSTGKRTVPIPVKEVEPQSIAKTMSATQDSSHVWALQKSATPAALNLGNTCAVDGDFASDNVTITISWQKLAAGPSGSITVLTTIDATNPSHREIQINLTDVIYGVLPGAPGESILDTKVFAPYIIGPNTTETIGTHLIVVPAGTTGLRDVATATYTDVVFPEVAIPGNNTAEASATVELSGNVLNGTATITDEEWITGNGLSFAVDSVSGVQGSFSNYTLGTKTTGPVNWSSGVQSGDGSVTFNKTVYAVKGTVEPNGKLSDKAILNGSDGFGPIEKTAETMISVDTKASLLVSKTIPNILQGAETATFFFDVKNSNDVVVKTVQLDFAAGQTSDSELVTDLVPGVYTVHEQPQAGWYPQGPIQVDLSAAICSGIASFTNEAVPAQAKVKKVTVPAGFEAMWAFALKDQGGNILEIAVTVDADFVAFETLLGEGSYTVVEAPQPGWTSDGGEGCSFTVNLPADAGKEFACTFTNTYVPSVDLTKSGDMLSKIGDDVTYTLELKNTSASGGPSDVPGLFCTVSDPILGFQEQVTLAAGDEETWTVPFTIPSGAADPFPNTATASCTFTGLADVVATDQASWSINLFQPSIKVTKTGPEYSKVGDVVTYGVKIENTSSADTPAMNLVSFVDTKVANPLLPASCNSLAAPGSYCAFTYDYTVQPGDDSGAAGATLTNKATATYNPAPFPNKVSDDDSWTLTLLHPSFTVAKVCTNEPVPQEGPATWNVLIKNTGDVELIITADDGVGTFNLAAGDEAVLPVSQAGPFVGDTEVSNTVTASWILPAWTGLANTAEANASAACRVGSRVDVIKLTNGVPTTSQSWSFAIYNGPDGFGTPAIATDSTPPALLDFGKPNLDPDETYTLCELGVPAGYSSLWQLDSDGDSIGDTTVVPYNPNADDSPPVDVGNRCVDFGYDTFLPMTAGDTLHLVVDNRAPGGAPRTPGYWKNWNRCSGGGQAANADRNGGWEEGYWLIEDVLNPSIGGGIFWDDIMADALEVPIDSCEEAVEILDQRVVSVNGKVGDGKKLASDAARTLAMHLLAAQLNFGAGACTTQEVLDKALEGETLLDKLNFDGTKTTAYLTTKSPDYASALSLAKFLDAYNNGLKCGDQLQMTVRVAAAEDAASLYLPAVLNR